MKKEAMSVDRRFMALQFRCPSVPPVHLTPDTKRIGIESLQSAARIEAAPCRYADEMPEVSAIRHCRVTELTVEIANRLGQE